MKCEKKCYMHKKEYIKWMSFLERRKSIGNERAKYKLVRAWKHYVYIIVSWLENKLIKSVNVDECALSIDGVRSEKITASLTTFPARIKEVRYAIMSIMLQTVQPDRIILWLAGTQFPGNIIPEEVRDLCELGLQVRFCDDLRSHKKYFYALQEQKPDEVVITFDDDIIYHPHTIERLIETHNSHPDSIICCQAMKAAITQDGVLENYLKWGEAGDFEDNNSGLLSPLTGSGCLYPYSILSEDTFIKEKLKTLAFSADDLWIYTMSRLSKVGVITTPVISRIFSVVSGSQTFNLSQINCLDNGNDNALINLKKEFPSAFIFID